MLDILFPSQHLLPIPLEKADKRVTRWMKLRLMNKDQTDRYMSKQLTRIGDKVLEDTGHVENVNRE